MGGKPGTDLGALPHALPPPARLESGWLCLGVSPWQLWPAMAEGTLVTAPGESTESSEESEQ